MPGVLTVEAIAQAGAVAVLADEENRGKIPFFAGIDDCRFKRVVEPGDVLTLECEFTRVRGPIAQGRGPRARRRRARGARRCSRSSSANDRRPRRRPRDLDHRARLQGARPHRHERRARAVRRHLRRVDPRAHGHPRAPDGCEGGGALRRRAAGVPRRARAGGLEGKDIDLLIVATVTPDMAFPSTGAILADQLGAADAAAYDLSAGCTGFMYALAQAYGMLAGGLAKRALVVGGDLLSRILDWRTARRSCSSATARARSCSRRSPEQGFLGFELGADGGGGENLWLPGSGSRIFDEPERHVKMNGREVFKFATRILVQSAEDAARGVRRHDRRRRRLRPAPGEHADHRPRNQEARRPV